MPVSRVASGLHLRFGFTFGVVAGLSVFGGPAACSDPVEPDPPPPADVPAPVALDVVLDDRTNVGDASDLTVTFDTRFDPSNVAEYRVFILDPTTAAGFTAGEAEALGSDRYTAVPATNGLQSVTLQAEAISAGGQSIAADVDYVARVLSVAGGSATRSTLSSPSNRVAIRETSIKITYLGNAGVLVEDENHRVLIDGLTGSLNGWVPIPSNDVSTLLVGGTPFDGITAVLVTHNHGDHFSPSVVTSFMSNNGPAVLLAPPQVRGGLSLGSRAIAVAPSRGSSETVDAGGVRVDVLHLRHFDQFGTNFGTVENYAYVVHIGGKKVLHVGDVAYTASNFAPFDLPGEDIDVAILPTFNTLLSAGNATVISQSVAPTNTLALHFQQPLISTEAPAAESLFGATALTRSRQFARF